MATILDDVKTFLDDLAVDLTRLHVGAAQLQNASGTPEADALAKIPGALIERAQALRADLEPHDAGSRAAQDEAKPKPKAAAKKSGR